jgi:hypothetical protein
MRRKIILLALIMTSHASFSALQAEDWTTRTVLYQETTGDHIDTCSCQIERINDGYLFIVSYSDEVYRFTTAPDFSARRCDISHSALDNPLIAERKGAQLLLRDNNGSDNLKIGELPWYQTPFSLAGFIHADNKKQAFVQVTTFDDAKKKKVGGSALNMIAKKEKRERIEIDSQVIDAVRTTITLPGLKSMFWKITYWYRLSDGLVVQYQDVRGGPGTPTTYGKLIKEETTR